MQQEKKLREQAEQFFEDAIRQLDDPERKEEVEGERETYIGVWMRGYRAGEAAPAAGREEDAVAFAKFLDEQRNSVTPDMWSEKVVWNKPTAFQEWLHYFKQQKENL